jgi:hypothetical protein
MCPSRTAATQFPEDHASTPTFHLSVPFLMPARVTDRQPTLDLTPGECAGGTYKTDPAWVRTK